ncbi:Transposase [Cordylochernes scorpioides]|uniref:Transposase n=1 Tax=Cordylochernes scorpioides TaxID=51811 RepID=A0ABY6KQ46_9ARAC|nr:Transposase [Cordylochernes scorpioides]
MYSTFSTINHCTCGSKEIKTKDYDDQSEGDHNEEGRKSVQMEARNSKDGGNNPPFPQNDRAISPQQETIFQEQAVNTPTTQPKIPQNKQATCRRHQTEVTSFYKLYLERLPRHQNDNQKPSLLTEQSSKLNVGATRVTSARVDRRILRQAVAAPQANCTAILQHVQDTLDHSISTRTISRRLGVPNALYQQDNARPHTARISQQALQDVQMLPWPPYSPELSPIEHVWDIIGRCLHALPQPRSEVELWQMVEREWRAIPQDAIRTLIDSLPRRVAACIAVRGGPTCY